MQTTAEKEVRQPAATSAPTWTSNSIYKYEYSESTGIGFAHEVRNQVVDWLIQL